MQGGDVPYSTHGPLMYQFVIKSYNNGRHSWRGVSNLIYKVKAFLEIYWLIWFPIGQSLSRH